MTQQFSFTPANTSLFGSPATPTNQPLSWTVNNANNTANPPATNVNPIGTGLFNFSQPLQQPAQVAQPAPILSFQQQPKPQIQQPIIPTAAPQTNSLFSNLTGQQQQQQNQQQQQQLAMIMQAIQQQQQSLEQLGQGLTFLQQQMQQQQALQQMQRHQQPLQFQQNPVGGPMVACHGGAVPFIMPVPIGSPSSYAIDYLKQYGATCDHCSLTRKKSLPWSQDLMGRVPEHPLCRKTGSTSLTNAFGGNYDPYSHRPLPLSNCDPSPFYYQPCWKDPQETFRNTKLKWKRGFSGYGHRDYDFIGYSTPQAYTPERDHYNSFRPTRDNSRTKFKPSWTDRDKELDRNWKKLNADLVFDCRNDYSSSQNGQGAPSPPSFLKEGPSLKYFDPYEQKYSFPKYGSVYRTTGPPLKSHMDIDDRHFYDMISGSRYNTSPLITKVNLPKRITTPEQVQQKSTNQNDPRRYDPATDLNMSSKTSKTQDEVPQKDEYFERTSPVYFSCRKKENGATYYSEDDCEISLPRHRTDPTPTVNRARLQNHDVPEQRRGFGRPRIHEL